MTDRPQIPPALPLVVFPYPEDEAWDGEPGPAVDDVNGATELDTTPDPIDGEPPERELPGEEP